MIGDVITCSGYLLHTTNQNAGIIRRVLNVSSFTIYTSVLVSHVHHWFPHSPYNRFFNLVYTTFPYLCRRHQLPSLCVRPFPVRVAHAQRCPRARRWRRTRCACASRRPLGRPAIARACLVRRPTGRRRAR